MVKEIKNNKGIYQCEVCGFKYREKQWAEKCEVWCRKNNSCNLEITQHSIKETQE